MVEKKYLILAGISPSFEKFYRKNLNTFKRAKKYNIICSSNLVICKFKFGSH